MRYIGQALVPKPEKREATLNIVKDRCKGCNLCIHFCPKEVLEESPEFNAKGYHFPRIIKGKEEACAACRYCEMVCPDFSIFVVESVEQS
jgi:2-oxoglutarate ferredoxin oxidoreductase subunit delta